MRLHDLWMQWLVMEIPMNKHSTILDPASDVRSLFLTGDGCNWSPNTPEDWFGSQNEGISPFYTLFTMSHLPVQTLGFCVTSHYFSSVHGQLWPVTNLWSKNYSSAAQEDLHIQDCLQLWHIADWLPHPWHYRAITLCCTAVNLSQARIHLSIASKKCSCWPLGMSIFMEPIHQKLCVCKADWLHCHTVWS